MTEPGAAGQTATDRRNDEYRRRDGDRQAVAACEKKQGK